ncbi:MAG: RDD family protein [Chitinophagaceae bacterium]|nr:RDD family protein [Chitinophagaceae bacterium]
MSIYQNIARRFIAGFIDILVFIPLSLIYDLILNYTENKVLIFVLTIISSFITLGYSVWLHSNYGQTIGKALMKIKVMDIDEKKLPSLKQAFLRESIYIIIGILGLLKLTYDILFSEEEFLKLIDNYSDFGTDILLYWLILELVSMFTNKKHRAIHDFIANTVVLKGGVPLDL